MDPAQIRIDELLAHAGWVRTLAARLVRDPDAADDVTQEVWAYALRMPPRERSNLRGWLAAAVRSAAHSLRRKEQRLKAREAAAFVPREELGPAEFVERAQLHRALVELVLALEEPHRSLVLAYWFEGLSVTEAGRRLGLSARVAQTRIDAALEQLRQHLDRQSGGRAAWSVPFLQWTQPVGLSTAAAGSAGVIALGGIAVATKWFAAGVAAIVLASFAWILWPRPELKAPVGANTGELALSPLTQPTQSGALPAAEAADARTALGVPKPQAAAAAEFARKPRRLVRGQVSGGPTGSLKETRITAKFLGGYVIPGESETLAADDGSFELDVTALAERWLQSTQPSELLLSAEHPLSLRSEVRTAFNSAAADAAEAPGGDLVYRCQIVLTTAAIVTGRVIVPSEWSAPADRYDSSPSSLRVGLFESVPGSRHGPAVVDEAICDSAGRWILRANHAGEFTVIAVASGLQAQSRTATLALGTSLELDAIELGLGASISGSVLRAGSPVGAGAVVMAEPEAKTLPRVSWRTPGGWDAMLQGEGSVYRANVRATTDASGRYRFDGLAEVRYELHVESVPDRQASTGGRPRVERIVKAPQANVDLVMLPPVIRLSISVDGHAPKRGELDGVEAMLVPLAPEAASMGLELTNRQELYGSIEVRPDFAHEFRVAAGRCEPLIVFVPALAMSDQRDVRLELRTRSSASTLRVRLICEESDKINYAGFAVIDPTAPAGSEPRTTQLERASDGTFVLANLASGASRVRVTPWTQWLGSIGTPYLATEFEVDLPVNQTLTREIPLVIGSRIRLGAKDERGGYLRAAVELRDARGDKLATDFYCITAGTRYGCGWYLCEQGLNDHPPLPAGHYELTLRAEGFEDEALSLDLLQGETRTLEPVLRRR